MVFRAADKDADVIANFEKNVDTAAKQFGVRKQDLMKYFDKETFNNFKEIKMAHYGRFRLANAKLLEQNNYLIILIAIKARFVLIQANSGQINVEVKKGLIR